MSLNSEQPWWLQHPGRNLCVESFLIAQEMCKVVQDIVNLPQIPFNTMVTRKAGCGIHITDELLIFRQSRQSKELLRRAEWIANGLAPEAKMRGVPFSAWCVRYRWKPYDAWHPGGRWYVYVGEPK